MTFGIGIDTAKALGARRAEGPHLVWAFWGRSYADWHTGWRDARPRRLFRARAMPTEPDIKRAVSFIDGQNLYRHAKDADADSDSPVTNPEAARWNRADSLSAAGRGPEDTGPSTISKVVTRMRNSA